MIPKSKQRILREYAAKLPTVLHNTHEVHIYTGQELIDMEEVPPKGQHFDPERKYLYKYPVQLASNHYRRLKKAYLKNGDDGIVDYLKQVYILMKRNEQVSLAK